MLIKPPSSFDIGGKMHTFWLLLSLALLMGLAAADEETINAADNAWVLISAALVLPMIPGVGLFYGGWSARRTPSPPSYSALP